MRARKKSKSWGRVSLGKDKIVKKSVGAAREKLKGLETDSRAMRRSKRARLTRSEKLNGVEGVLR